MEHPYPVSMEGGHVNPANFEEIGESKLGSSRDLPFLMSPDDWNENGLPYGAWCLCSECGDVGRSTYTFDFFADGPNEPLFCQDCQFARAERDS